MKQALKSKTILFNVLMGGIEALHAGIQLFDQLLTPDQFASMSIILGLVHGMGGVYLRTITTEALSEK